MLKPQFLPLWRKDRNLGFYVTVLLNPFFFRRQLAKNHFSEALREGKVETLTSTLLRRRLVETTRYRLLHIHPPMMIERESIGSEDRSRLNGA